MLVMVFLTIHNVVVKSTITQRCPKQASNHMVFLTIHNMVVKSTITQRCPKHASNHMVFHNLVVKSTMIQRCPGLFFSQNKFAAIVMDTLIHQCGTVLVTVRLY